MPMPGTYPSWIEMPRMKRWNLKHSNLHQAGKKSSWVCVWGSTWNWKLFGTWIPKLQTRFILEWGFDVGTPFVENTPFMPLLLSYVCFPSSLCKPSHRWRCCEWSCWQARSTPYHLNWGQGWRSVWSIIGDSNPTSFPQGTLCLQICWILFSIT